MTQRHSFMDELKEHDPEFFELVNAVGIKARGKGALDSKTKTLITLALDAAGGHPDGVKNIAARARAIGVKEEELKEVVRLAFMSAGIPGLIAGLAAFRE